MGILSSALHRDEHERSSASAAFGSSPAPEPATPLPPVPGQPAAADGRSEPERRRDVLAERVTELHWDLGGLAYEMAIRDHFRLDVLVRRAAMLQESDAELAEVERLIQMEAEGTAGSCPQCMAPHSRGALYCSQCGASVLAPPASDASPSDTSDALDALLAPHAEPPVDHTEA